MPSSAVIVPLYIYPFPGAWTPLYEAIKSHPNTQFLVIVNPSNGPGASPLPDANYCREIPRLRSQNVAIYGYVNVSWSRRDLNDVCKDVEIYAAWPEQQQQQAHCDTQLPPHQNQDLPAKRLDKIFVDGIFVDETPIAASRHEVLFLGSLRERVLSRWPPASNRGVSLRPLPSIIHNPGCMPPPAVRDLADLTVAFEDTHANFLRRLKQGVFALPGVNGTSGNNVTGSQELAEQERQRRAVVIHSVPVPDTEDPIAAGSHSHEQARRAAETRELVSKAKEVAGVIFITELSSGFYESFSRGWAEWAGDIGAR